MPKVSQEYRDARRAEILAAARRCFVRNGFHETSMQDVFAESKLSAGAVYRYFPSKDEMILAIAEENLRDVIAVIHAEAAQPHSDGVGATVARALDVVRERTASDAVGPIALLVWAEAVRSPDLARRFEALLAPMRTDLAELVVTRQREAALPGAADPDGTAALLLAVVSGYILQLTLFGPDAVASVPAALRTVIPG